MTTNPFRHYPLFLARLPRIVRLYIFHSFIGFVLSGIFTALIIGTNVGNIGHLVNNVAGGWIAATVFFVLNGIVFAGVQTGIVIMSLGNDDDQSGTRTPIGQLTPDPILIPIEPDQK
jgi:hypothetical protein